MKTLRGKSKVRAGTTTHAVLMILNDRRYFPWLTMRDIIMIGADRGLALTLNTVATALASLEPSHHVEVRRDSRPYRYRGCSSASTDQGSARRCPSRWGQYECVLPPGHAGDHATEGQFTTWHHGVDDRVIDT